MGDTQDRGEKMRGYRDINIARAYRIVVMLALLVHVVFAGMFFILRIHCMGYYNIAIAAVYVLIYFLIHNRHYRLGVVLVHLEVSSFASATTIIMGWEYGFWVYFYALASLIYFNPYRNKRIIYLFPVVEMVIFFITRVVSRNMEPLLSADDRLVPLFFCLNTVTGFIVVIAGALASGISLESMRQERDRIARDSLTGVYCREYFIQKTEAILRRNPRKKYYLMLTNISGFKYYNEIFGEKKGDEVLIAQADALKRDSAELALFGRVSGNEFGVLMEEKYFQEDRLVENIHNLQEYFTNEQYKMHIHVGIYCIQKVEEPVSLMLDKAKMAIDTLKGEYSDCYAFYQNDMLEHTLHEKKVLGEFEHALETGQFDFYLQPQISTNGECQGAEALVRWIHPDRGVVPPIEFIPVLEHTGLIWKLDCHVWEQVARKLKEWELSGRERMYISVNISARDFYYLDIYKTFTGLVEKYRIDPKRLKLELTETALMTEAETQIALIGRLREYGFEVEIDDFGSGYSSLNMLKDIHADVLKIDMAFLRKTENVERSWAILKSVLDLAQSIGMRAITEGVETQEQVLRLKQIGCHMFQGYYFSKPLPVQQFEKIYQ